MFPLVQDGFHIAWAETSAATPYTTGVIALMLPKNPNLNNAQIREIFKKTATTNKVVGAVPNFQWGYGMLNPEAAIKVGKTGKYRNLAKGFREISRSKTNRTQYIFTLTAMQHMV